MDEFVEALFLETAGAIREQRTRAEHAEAEIARLRAVLVEIWEYAEQLTEGNPQARSWHAVANTAKAALASQSVPAPEPER
jgi:hypothetical protein